MKIKIMPLKHTVELETAVRLLPNPNRRNTSSFEIQYFKLNETILYMKEPTIDTLLHY